MEFESEVQTATTILGQRCGADVSLELCRVVSGGPEAKMVMLRCAPRGGDLPETVLVKRWHARPDPYRRETACLDFLCGLPKVGHIFPMLYGWDDEWQLMIVEDLGDRPGRWLGDILFGDDRQRAVEALMSFQHSVGRMHAATVDRIGAFRQVQAVHGATQKSGDRTDQLPDQLRDFPRLVRLLGIAQPPGMAADIDTATGLVESPGPFRTFVHGDTTLANAFLTETGIRIYDVESGGVRHCLTDGAFSRMRYLESSLAHQLPLDLRRQMMAQYREALSEGCSAATDDDVFLPAFAACCACWMAHLCHDLPSYLEADRQWGRAGERARVVAALENFAELSEEWGQFEALGETAGAMVRILRARWSEADWALPTYPALLA